MCCNKRKKKCLSASKLRQDEEVDDSLNDATTSEEDKPITKFSKSESGNQKQVKEQKRTNRRIQ